MPTGISRQRLADGQIIRTYERSTDETTDIEAPIYFYDDFFGGDDVIPANASDESGCLWTKSASNGTVAKQAAVANGRIVSTMTNADTDQKAILCMNDQLSFNVGALGVSKYAQCEFKFAFDHTASDTLAGIHFLMGLCSAVPASLAGTDFWDSQLTVLAGIEISAGVATASSSANTSLWLTTDDTASDTTVDTGDDLVEETEYILRIDFTDLSDVKFYLNGVRKGASTTFDMTTLTAAEALLQPYFGSYKHTTEGDLGGSIIALDYFKFWGIR